MSDSFIYTNVIDSPQTSKEPLICANLSFQTVFLCESLHETTFPIRCNKCDLCRNYEARRWYAKSIVRINLVIEIYHMDYVTMWTLGTSLTMNPLNLTRVKKMWRRFTKSMSQQKIRNGRYWSPLFYVMEEGSKARKIHVHFIHRGYAGHTYIKKLWRSITEEESNVNYTQSYRKKERSQKDTVRMCLNYLYKYMAKSPKTKNWLGLARKVKLPGRQKFWCKFLLEDETKCDLRLFYSGQQLI